MDGRIGEYGFNVCVLRWEVRGEFLTSVENPCFGISKAMWRSTTPHRLYQVYSHMKMIVPSLSLLWGINTPLRTTGNNTPLKLLNPTAEISLLHRNGRWRSTYIYSPSSTTLTGTIKVDVHYYEEGNVRLVTKKDFSENPRSGTAADIVKTIAIIEKKYQEELNRAFGALSEGAFKSLRRQLPITRQKINWDKVMTYRVRIT